MDALQTGYALRTSLRPVAAHKRIAICGTRVFTDPVVVTQELGSGERVARWSGVVLCNRAGCPVCAEHKARKFGQRVRRALGAGGVWQHVICTVAHTPGDGWSVTYDRLLEGIRQLTKGAAGAVLHGVLEATIRATETTWSVAHGWHVHFHVLWRVSRSLLDAEKAVLTAEWCARTGAHEAHGLHFGATFDCSDPMQQGAAARYVAKLAHEMSGGHKHALPGHFTLGEVYGRAAAREPRFVGLVREYQEATHARRIYQFDRRATAIERAAPELDETKVLREWRTPIDRLEFSGLSRAERWGGEPLAVYLPLEVAAASRGDPSEAVTETVNGILRQYDGRPGLVRA